MANLQKKDIETVDPIGKIRFCQEMHGFEGYKKYFWHCAAILKLLILIGRTIYAYETLNEPKKVAELVATYPVRFMDHADFTKTTMLFNLTGSCMIQLAFYAIPASDLREQSISVIDALENSDWYLFKSPLKRALVFVMMNTEKGITITAGGMANVDNEVLIAVVQKALSAITLLRALIED
ncbi:unnamed protein product [Acanthoscelides obtectus]|uniref:Uncharacterized protein n=1 Tax=Acanthoscelides obtectus TaxID=200917 RepID=A0A9P0PGM9_ACAOB|nr:unnamed protein product [Acanthoscelides obtectus]CAK1653946.1 hypothetical protein AOBTE_LOCUS18401 [Acanthoscelides obtectus]